MPSFHLPRGSWLLLFALCLVLLPGKAEAFGAGNIPSIAQVSSLHLIYMSKKLTLDRSKVTTGDMEVC